MVMKNYCTLFFLCFAFSVSAVIKLPSFITDNMMIQRDAPVKIFGWADRGENISVEFNGKKIETKTGKDGMWKIQFSPMQYGGPYEMNIKGKTENICIKNILIGDIWICSGQSNMEWIVYNSNDAQNEIAQAQYPDIRLLNIKPSLANFPQNNTDTDGWKICSPQSVGNFSAVGYFFGRDLYRQLNIPVGLINTSLGGTQIEPWTSVSSMLSLKEYKSLIDTLQSAGFEKRLQKKGDVYLKNLADNDLGIQQKWYMPDTDLSNWKMTRVPGSWRQNIGKGEGVVWYSREFALSPEQAREKIIISLGAINDWDETYLNGMKIGSTHTRGVIREYATCAHEQKAGKNILTVKITSANRFSGFASTNNSRIYCQTNNARIPLSGQWKYKISKMGTPIVTPNDYPTLLYNAMIAPLTNFPVKGIIWYQGESNSNEAYKYRILFSNMIQDWRNAWKQSDLPFYFVQLTSFGPKEGASNSNWAELRESQHKALSLPYTGEAVTIDIGDAKEIHPRNKQDVGYRLALNALAKTYGKKIEYSGPEYHSMKIVGDKIIITFDHMADGLEIKGRYGYLQGFSIAGSDQKFEWAKAYIQGNKVVVYNENVKNPVAVRYAWENNALGANLYNSSGLPASPFRTDNWILNTQK